MRTLSIPPWPEVYKEGPPSAVGSDDMISVTLFENDSITDINYPELLTAFYHYIIYMHIKKAYKN